MSETMAGSRRTKKTTCRKCNRTVIVLELEGGRIEADPELLNVIPLDRPGAEPVLARRTHADLCERYQQDAAKAKLLEEARRFNRKTAAMNARRGR